VCEREREREREEHRTYLVYSNKTSVCVYTHIA
jgi:hypothetical protein